MTQILTYYRGRVEAFEHDRTQWYDKLQAIRPKQELVHRVEWEIKKRQEEKAELERIMGELQNTLVQERERIVAMKEQTDALKVKGKENRELIIQLLENNNAVEQHVYYQKDAQPEKIQSYSKTSLVKSGVSRAGGSLRKTIEEHKANPAIHYDYHTPNVLRTIYLPNDQSTHMRSEVESLHLQIQQQRAHYESILNKLRDARSETEESQRQRYVQVADEIERTLQQLQDQEIFNYQVVRDHVECMVQFEAEERKLQEETEAIRIENAELRDQIRDISNKAESKKREVKQEYEKSAQEYSEKFREQSRTQKENIAIIKDQYKKVQEIYKRKMDDMQDKLGKEGKKMEVAERRRKLELEGYSADLSAMGKKIVFYQKYIAKMKRAVDEERGGNGLLEMSDEDVEEDQQQRQVQFAQQQHMQEGNQQPPFYQEGHVM
ncbi:hypothetical protein FGO68_gene13151 [Halteria grandinella]|uniref:Uncharacterized protein n=1 Tax=Halteria grandinella TaxID=5974 RepID=A0A8J8NSM4_HALGN|nr:hypothetical protein FGO68_gene13151 [Halteria grandinella]